MDKQQISERFYSLVSPSHPNDWEVDDIVDNLSGLPDQFCRELLNHVSAVWPISHSLCYRYLEYGAGQIHMITPKLLPEWIRQLLYHYEKGGLREGEVFMADVKKFLHSQRSISEVKLAEVSMSMTHYIRGVSGLYLKIAENGKVWTDTDTIYLPAVIDLFSTREENRLFYKFLVTYQWSLIHLGVFKLFLGSGLRGSLANHVEAQELKKFIAGSEKAAILLKFYLFVNVCQNIKTSLPGLWKRSSSLILSYFSTADNQGAEEDERRLFQHITDDLRKGTAASDSGLRPENRPIEAPGCIRFIQKWLDLDIGELNLPQQFILGELKFSKAELVIKEQREQDKKAFTEMLARILPEKLSVVSPDSEQHEDSVSGEKEADGAIGVIAESLQKMVEEKERKTIQLENAHVTVPDELITIAEKITTDLGSVPIGYVQAASGLAGGGRMGNDSTVREADLKFTPEQRGYVYDEWDCRRNGYRRDWCTVVDEELVITRSNFIQQTLQKHNGLRKRLRTQFELMRSSHRFVRRQRDGDDLDLDAIIDAMGDARAGTSVSERLFVRLERDERSITTLFLIDMSNSTSGWIGTFIKESLVLLCEAMEKVGDQYGIYGFSGMKRSGCKLYHIKNLDEPYNEETRNRISAIGPKEYTRMAPAVRHLTSLLEKSDSKTRLLMCLSDGKPEDYDGYNGEYAIEDTKKALLEARGKGIDPFCITVDKRAHDYLDHMYGVGNYVFINRIENLPARMAQIYRVLTR